MTKPEKRWQLLLVADDGRIIPFKHIKGIALSLMILLVLLGLLCAGLIWQLNKEKITHRQTLDRLAAAKHEAARYKSENEVVTAELVLAEARMQKAGLAVPKRQVRVEPKKAVPTAVGAEPATANRFDDQTPEKPASGEHAAPRKANPASMEPGAPVKPKDTGTDAPPATPPAAADLPVVAVGELQLDYSPSTGSVKATFRLSNTGPRSSSVKGSCLAVLKSDPAESSTWVGLTDGALVEGTLDPKKGKQFKISRFIDLDMERELTTDPSSYTTATVYVFDDAGAILLEKDFSVSLPAPAPRPASPSLAAGASAAEASANGDAGESAVTLSRFEMQHDTSDNMLRATFRVSNTGPRSSPVAGRCVVVLKNDRMDPGRWLALPDGAIVDGQPDKENGQPFKISRFKKMEIDAAVKADPSVFDRAVVFVFGQDGGLVLEKAYSIRLPAPVSKPEPTPAPAPVDASPADAAAVPSADDPPVSGDAAPETVEDHRARF